MGYHRMMRQPARTRMPTAYTDIELEVLMSDFESDLVERKAAFDGDAPRAVRQAICAFANDLPDRRRPGVVFIGVRDDGTPAGLEINDALLLKLAHCKTDGNILPLPAMTVGKHTLRGADVAVVTVAPAHSPPVEIGSGPTETRRATYPLPALQELARNAVMHRAYEATNSPVAPASPG